MGLNPERVPDPEALMVEVTAGLRSLAEDREAAPPFSAVRNIVDYLVGRQGDLAIDPVGVALGTGLTPEQVCDVVASLGTFLGQSRRQSAGRALAHSKRRAAEVKEFEERFGVKERRKVTTDQLYLFPRHTKDEYVLPHGWERTATGRELDRAVANIVASDPDDATLRRWMLRQWGNAAVPVSFELVSSLWTLARLGRIHEVTGLATIGAGNPSLARALADAWEILEVSRAEAVAAVERLCEPGRAAVHVRDDVARARWLAESDLVRVERAAERAAGGEPGTQALLDREVEEFAARVAADPDRLRPAKVAQLNSGQVRRLCEGIGLDPDGDSRLRRQVSAKVAEAGLSVDSDRLVGLGVAAARAGLDDLFTAALERRSNGELDWADELHEALGIDA